MVALPDFPLFVVTTITPFAPCEPYTAVEAASLSIVMVSISEGLMLPALLPTITPSTTHNGSVLPFTVVFPLIIIFPASPGCPDPEFT